MRYDIFSRLLLSVLLHTVWSFPTSHPCVRSLEASSNNRLAKGMQRSFSAICGARKLAKQSASEETAPFHNRSSPLCYYSPVPPTVISPKLWGKEQISVSSTVAIKLYVWLQGLSSYLSSSLTDMAHQKVALYGKIHDFWDTAGRWCDATSLRSVLQSTAAPRRWHSIEQNYIGAAGFFHVLVKTSIKILLCLSSRWTRILVK